MPTRSPDKLKTQVASEACWQREVQNCAHMHGWKWFHQYDSRWAKPGFPDLVLAKDGNILFIELKSDCNNSKLRVEQAQWIEALTGLSIDGGDDRRIAEALFERYEETKHTGCVHVMIWRPRDRALVLEVLRSGGRRNGNSNTG